MKKTIPLFAPLIFFALTSCAYFGVSAKKDYEALTKDSSVATAGWAIYKKNCVSCHGEMLDGLVGPDLTDERWKYGDGTVPAIMDTVTEGVEKNGMPSWKQKLSKDDIETVAIFVRSKRGSNEGRPESSAH